MKTNVLDMTEGNPVRHIIIFSIPALIGNVFQQVYNLVDSVIVGQFVGADALAAVGVTGSITFFFFALCNGIAVGGGIVASQFFGAKDDKSVKNCIVNTAIVMTIVPIFIGILGYLQAQQFLIFLGTPENILGEAVEYARLLCMGLLFVSIYNFVSSMLRALGDSRTPLYFLILSSLLNVVLDVIFVYSLNMGVFGAGLATVVAQIVAALTCLVFAISTNEYFRIKKEDIFITRSMLWKILRIGLPISLQFSLIAISTMAVQKVVNSFGTVAVAAYTATSRIEQLVHSPYQTLQTSLSTYCGQNYGAKKHDRVIEGYRKSLGIMAIITLALVLVMQLLGEAITSLFVSDAKVIALGAEGLRLASWFYLALGLIYVVRGILNGVGDAFFALLNGIIEVIGRFTLPILMTSYLGFGVRGIWISGGLVWVISGLTAWIRYIQYYWIKVKK